jgi:hypothetical protein
MNAQGLLARLFRHPVSRRTPKLPVSASTAGLPNRIFEGSTTELLVRHAWKRESGTAGYVIDDPRTRESATVQYLIERPWGAEASTIHYWLRNPRGR